MAKLRKRYSAVLNGGVTPVEQLLEGKTISTGEILQEKAESDGDTRESVKVEFHSKGENFGITAWAPMGHLLALGIFSQDDSKEVTFHPGVMIKGRYNQLEVVEEAPKKKGK